MKALFLVIITFFCFTQIFSQDEINFQLYKQHYLEGDAFYIGNNILSKNNKTPYGSFSLKDAIDYAEYLINATANFQRFANTIPSVGGEVDVALITSFRPFVWIKCKELTTRLEERI